MIKNNWEVPQFQKKDFFEKRSKYCICIPVINEGEKIKKQLSRMPDLTGKADIIILDGGSTDGSLADDFLRQMNVRTLMTKKDRGKLSAQLRMGFVYAIEEGYEGIITVDGNNKDSVESIPQFIEELEQGFDFVQGSRYVPGGEEVNTPLTRKVAIKLIHAPFISMLAGFRYTDTTNGFRAHSIRLLQDEKLQPFRKEFDTYELLAYLSVKAPRLGYKVKEIPVKRSYPVGKVPTKISPLRGNLLLMKILLNLAFKKYDPN
ncbi:glycosyltransferase family 2 protein [Paenibacillus hunanensis]|uniref:glycosyltransferase family 2 protein n=1 Tax=Paenibacillus hunanensis TaxID=539262 RepID=UPI0020266875|nr:glycosyltransferase family 2 protein [Paenibacillus hunanensis]MCL9662835.1 glycosyltransferase family 2 protein [Paenibacillus hunanensis]